MLDDDLMEEDGTMVEDDVFNSVDSQFPAGTPGRSGYVYNNLGS